MDSKWLAAIVGGLIIVSGAASGGTALATPPAPMQLASPATVQSAERQARSYLEISGFSRTGLIQQLQYEGFSGSDAATAVDSLTVNWNAQAARKAKEYLEISGFSRQGMIEQLQHEGFTSSQAAYGASAVGL